MVVEARREYVDQVYSIFKTIGHALRLFIKESRVKAIFIFNEPMPNDIQALDCVWESGEDMSKLLGFYVGTKISANLSKRHLENILDKRLHDARLNPYSIPVKVVVANQMINNMFSYTIQLWSGDIKDLEWIDKEVKDFSGMGKKIPKRH